MSKIWIVECAGCGKMGAAHWEKPARAWWCSTACYRAHIAQLRAAGQQVLL